MRFLDMKKVFGIALAAALLSITAGFGVEQIGSLAIAEASQQGSYLLGSDAIAKIRDDYRQGRYNSFFKEMDAFYDDAAQDLPSIRGGLSEDDFAKIRELRQEFDQKLNEALLSADSALSQKIVSAMLSTSDDLFQRLHQKEPGEGKNNDENALIALDVEYQYKALHLDRPSNEGDPQEIRQKHYALKMEQMDKMLLASQSFEDQDLKQAVQAYGENIDQHLSHSWDFRDLYTRSTPK